MNYFMINKSFFIALLLIFNSSNTASLKEKAAKVVELNLSNEKEELQKELRVMEGPESIELKTIPRHFNKLMQASGDTKEIAINSILDKHNGNNKFFSNNDWNNFSQLLKTTDDISSELAEKIIEQAFYIFFTTELNLETWNSRIKMISTWKSKEKIFEAIKTFLIKNPEKTIIYGAANRSNLQFKLLKTFDNIQSEFIENLDYRKSKTDRFLLENIFLLRLIEQSGIYKIISSHMEFADNNSSHQIFITKENIEYFKKILKITNKFKMTSIIDKNNKENKKSKIGSTLSKQNLMSVERIAQMLSKGDVAFNILAAARILNIWTESFGPANTQTKVYNITFQA